MGRPTGAFMKKIFTAVVLALATAFSVGSAVASAEHMNAIEVCPEESPAELAVAAWFDGAGTAESPYIISSYLDLTRLSSFVAGGHKSYVGAYYKLSCDIDCRGETSFKPIGTAENPFCGHFDGNGYSVDGLTISSTDGGYIGLFGYTSNASIQNLRVSNASISVNASAKSYVGTIVGFFGGNLSGTDTYVSACSADGNITVKSTESSYVGGLFGQIGISGSTKREFSDLSANVNVYCETPKLAYAGGIVGSVKNGAVLARCATFGSVTATCTSKNGNASAGGVSAWLQTDDGYIYASGQDGVSSLALSTKDIYDCLSASVVTANSQGSSLVGNIVAYAVSEITSGNLYCDESTAVNGAKDSLKGLPKSFTELCSESFLTSMLGFDFDSVWHTVLGKPTVKCKSAYIASERKDDGDTTLVTVQPVNCGGCTVIASGYSIDGRLASASCKKYSDKALSFELICGAYYKLFAMDGDFSPLCRAEIIE